MNTEKLLYDKEETEFVIQTIDKAIKKQEEVKDKFPIGIVRDEIEVCIRNLKKQKEWNIEILQEIEDSIEFEARR